MFNCQSLEVASKSRDRIIEEYRMIAESTMTYLDDGFEHSMAVMFLSVWLQRCYRISNHIEGLNKELKMHLNVIGFFLYDESLLRLVESVLIEMHDATPASKVFFSLVSLISLLESDVPSKLIVIAGEQ